MLQLSFVVIFHYAYRAHILILCPDGHVEPPTQARAHTQYTSLYPVFGETMDT